MFLNLCLPWTHTLALRVCVHVQWLATSSIPDVTQYVQLCWTPADPAWLSQHVHLPALPLPSSGTWRSWQSALRSRPTW
jgi:hypothetical protein